MKSNISKSNISISKQTNSNLNPESIINNEFNTIQYIRSTMKRLNYRLFTTGTYNFNIISVRNTNSKRSLNSNNFNDTLYLIYRNQFEIWRCESFHITTDPGIYYRQNICNPSGCAIMKPGQYRSLYKIGLHKGYPALVQNSPVTVYRDNNLDSSIDITDNTPTQTGFFGINVHSTNNIQNFPQKVDKWSAGCQVFQSQKGFDYFLYMLRKQRSAYFTYTLLESTDLRIK